MACFSIIRTTMTERDRILDALKALGYQITDQGQTITGTKNSRTIRFTQSGGGGYSVSGATERLGNIQKKYAEIGVVAWAKSRGYTVQDSDGTRMVLISRRG